MYVEDVDGPLYRLDPSTGEEIWKLDRLVDERNLQISGHAPDVWLIRSSFSIEGDDRAPILRRVDFDTGAVLWAADGREGTEFQWTRPVVLDGLAILMDVTNNPGSSPEIDGQAVRAYDVETGALQWTTDLANPLETFDFGLMAVLESENGKALILTTGGDVLRIDPRNGEVLWRTAVGNARLGGTDFAGEDDRLAIDIVVRGDSALLPEGRTFLDFQTGEVLSE